MGRVFLNGPTVCCSYVCPLQRLCSAVLLNYRQTDDGIKKIYPWIFDPKSSSTNDLHIELDIYCRI